MCRRSLHIGLVAGSTLSLVLAAGPGCSGGPPLRADYSRTAKDDLAIITRSIDDASRFLAEWGTVTISAPMVSTSAHYFRFEPRVSDDDLVAGRAPEGGNVRNAWKATFVNLAAGSSLLNAASLLTKAASDNPEETAAKAKEAQAASEEQMAKIWEEFAKMDENVQGSLRRHYRGAASDRFELGLHQFLSDPADSLPDSYRPAYVVFTVHCQPGWRTRDGYIGRVDVEARYEEPPTSHAVTPATPLVTAIYPATEMQDLMLVNSVADRQSTRAGGAAPWGSVGFSSDGGVDVASATRTGLNVTTAFISGGGQFGYEFRPTYRATADLNRLGSAPGFRLDPVAFPAVAIVGVRRGDWRFSDTEAAKRSLQDAVRTRAIRVSLAPEYIAEHAWDAWQARVIYGSTTEIIWTMPTQITAWDCDNGAVRERLEEATKRLRLTPREVSLVGSSWVDLKPVDPATLVAAYGPRPAVEKLPSLLKGDDLRARLFTALKKKRRDIPPILRENFTQELDQNESVQAALRLSDEQARMGRLLEILQNAYCLEQSQAKSVAESVREGALEGNAASATPPGGWVVDRQSWGRLWDDVCDDEAASDQQRATRDAKLRPFALEPSDAFGAALQGVADEVRVEVFDIEIARAFGLLDEAVRIESNEAAAAKMCEGFGNPREIGEAIERVMRARVSVMDPSHLAGELRAGASLDVESLKTTNGKPTERVIEVIGNAGKELTPTADVRQVVDKMFEGLDRATLDVIQRQLSWARGGRALRFRANYDWRREGSRGILGFADPGAMPEAHRTTILANLDDALHRIHRLEKPTMSENGSSREIEQRTLARLRADIGRLQAQLQPAESVIEIPNLFDPSARGVRIVQTQEPEPQGEAIRIGLVLTNGGRLPLATRARMESIDGSQTLDLGVVSGSVRENQCELQLDKAWRHKKTVEEMTKRPLRIVLYTSDGIIAQSEHLNWPVVRLPEPPKTGQ